MTDYRVSAEVGNVAKQMKTANLIAYYNSEKREMNESDKESLKRRIEQELGLRYH